ncbi:hypothetical protein GMDG_08779 [Pseudogymnoascus destructans 20631-21]|uniref:Uncharacterized protein n=1 Tax=Pseudogymnoascus destructans (strain ATCC MYA-4855 / 20631-21) TaxID=658429 RepID=L8FLZ4_PSED2|nr:hypothetical protein GMDG_08779 [Pseudogymnoascus destructans 20631-21]
MAYTAEEKAAMAARNDPEQDQASLAEGASIPSSANQTNELHDPNFKSKTFLHTLGKTAQERHESILANRHEKAEWNVETFDEFQKLSAANQKMAWTLHKNILPLSQTTLVKNCIARHQGSSPTPIFATVTALAKGTEILAHEMTLLSAEVRTLRAANEALSKRQRAKKSCGSYGANKSREAL